MKAARLIYLLTLLIASQSVWSMLDEHSYAAETDQHSEQFILDETHSDDNESSENCFHCCHCHFQQVSVIPPTASTTMLPLRSEGLSRAGEPLAEGPPSDLFRPPIS